MPHWTKIDMRPIQAIQQLAKVLANANIDDAQTDARLAGEAVFGMDYAHMITTDTPATTQQLERLQDIQAKRLAGEPIQYILGNAWFMGLHFAVRKGILIPRRDSETIVEATIRLAPQGATLLDLCCGSGCLGLSIAHARPDITLTLADISTDAIQVSKQNAARLGLDARLVQTDLFAQLQGDRFDVIISNPPYIPTADIASLAREVRHEPSLALDGGTDGLDIYRRIIPDALCHLASGGLLGLEFGFGQQDDIAALLEQHGYRAIQVFNDMEQRPRAAFAIGKDELPCYKE